jgi:hypothetical protein
MRKLLYGGAHATPKKGGPKMLKVIVPLEAEVYDESTNKFKVLNNYTMVLEHSLASLSKWEEQHEKPFLNTEQKTTDETHSYFECMSVAGEIPPEVFRNLTPEHYSAINKYLDAKMTATWFNDPPNAPRSRDVITAEIIYYYMISLSIPFECQYWHLNKLLTLIKVCNQKNQPPKKRMSRNELAQRNRDLNAERKAKLGTRG